MTGVMGDCGAFKLSLGNRISMGDFLFRTVSSLPRESVLWLREPVTSSPKLWSSAQPVQTTPPIAVPPA